MVLGLSIDVTNAAGVIQGSGPVIPGATEYTRTLDAIGNFKFALPLGDPKAPLCVQGAYIKLYHEEEGWIAWGIIDKRESVLAADGQFMLTVSGGTIGRELYFGNSDIARNYTGQTLANFFSGAASGVAGGYANGILNTVSGWGVSILTTPAIPGATAIVARFDGTSTWQMMDVAAKQFRMHMREQAVARAIDFGAFGASSGVTFANIKSANQPWVNTTLFPISAFKVIEESTAVENFITALGAGEGSGVLDLRYSDRTTGAGYTYQPTSFTAPDGVSVFYAIRDTASITAYGQRKKVIAVKEIIPLSNSAAGWKAASNALCDIASTYLVRHKDPQTTYEVTVELLPNLVPGSATELIRPGDTVRLQYAGEMTRMDGTPAGMIGIDTTVTILSMTRAFRDDGGWSWRFTVSTIDRLNDSLEKSLATVFNNVYMLNYQPQSYVYSQSFNLSRAPMDDNHAATLVANLDGNIGKVLKATLTFTLYPIRTWLSSFDTSGPDALAGVVAGLNANTGNNNVVGDPHVHPQGGSGVNVASSVHIHNLGLTVNDFVPANMNPIHVYVNGHDINGSGYSTLNVQVSVDVSQWVQDANGLVAAVNNTVVFLEAAVLGHGPIDVEAQLTILATAASIPVQ